jgi:hypothetical protein
MHEPANAVWAWTPQMHWNSSGELHFVHSAKRLAMEAKTFHQ